MPISLKKAVGGGGTPVGGLVYLPQHYPVVVEDSTGTFLRSGSIETDVGKFDNTYWNSVGTFLNEMLTSPTLPSRVIRSVSANSDNSVIVYGTLSSDGVAKGGVYVKGGSNLQFNAYANGQGTNDITYSNTLGLWVAVGEGGKIHTSPDGVSWTARTSGTTESFTHIHWNGSLFVAVPTNETKVYVSSNGTSWTAQNLPTQSLNTQRIGVLFADSLWVILIGWSATITSPDGINWQWNTTTGMVSSNLRGLLHDGTRFLTASYNASGGDKVYSSTDAVNWVALGALPVTSASHSVYIGRQSIAYYNEYFYVADAARFRRTKDYISWEHFSPRTSQQEFSTLTSWNGLYECMDVVNNKLHVVGSSSGTSVYFVAELNDFNYAGVVQSLFSMPHNTGASQVIPNSQNLIGYVRIS